jgi:beta-lactamase regulating signal transducer with metallopeptidase domain
MDAQLIEYLFKVAICLAAGYLFYHFLLRNDVNFLGNRLFLLFMLPLSFLLPLAPLQSPFRSLTISPEALATVTAMPAAAAPVATPIASLVVILYWAGAALLMLRILFHLFHLYRLQHSHPRERLRNVTLVRVAAPIPPFSFFNRIFLHTPKNSDAGEIEQIISHESVHIRQLHSLDILVMEVVVALQWFNPVVWFYRKALKETHEYLADREVIAQGFNADGYRLLLFEQQFGAKLFEFASHLKQSQIKRRMFMMNRMHKAGKAPFKIILALPLIALLALAWAKPRLMIAQGAPADEKQEVAQKKDKPAMSEQELKDLQVKLEEKAKFLEEKLNSTTDPEEKQKLKQALDDLYKKRQYLMTEHGLAPKEKAKGVKYIDEEKLKELMLKLEEKEKTLKELYADADTPEKKEKIKQDLDMFYKKRQALLSDYRVAKVEKPSREELEKKLQKVKEIRLKLKQVISEEKDEAKAKELKMKFAELGEIEEKLKTKLDESSPKRP